MSGIKLSLLNSVVGDAYILLQNTCSHVVIKLRQEAEELGIKLDGLTSPGDRFYMMAISRETVWRALEKFRAGPAQVFHVLLREVIRALTVLLKILPWSLDNSRSSRKPLSIISWD